MPLPKNPTKETTKPNAPLAPSVAPPPGFHQQAQQPMRAWDTPGQTVLAYFLGMRDSTKYSGRKLVDLVDDDGIVETYPCPVLLEQLLRGIAPRTPIYIHYRGEEGQTKQFELFVQNGGGNNG